MVNIQVIHTGKPDYSYLGDYTAYVDMYDSTDVGVARVRLLIQGNRQISNIYRISGEIEHISPPRLSLLSEIDFGKGLPFNSLRSINERFTRFLEYYYTTPIIDCFVVQEVKEYFSPIPLDIRRLHAAVMLSYCDKEEGDILLFIKPTNFGFMVSRSASMEENVIKIRTKKTNILKPGVMRIHVDLMSSVIREIFLLFKI